MQVCLSPRSLWGHLSLRPFLSSIFIAVVVLPSVALAHGADLTVTKSGPATAEAGDIITYDIRIAGSGYVDYVVDTPPAGLIFDNAIGVDCSITDSGNIRCDGYPSIPAIVMGNPYSFQLQFKVPPCAPCRPLHFL